MKKETKITLRKYAICVAIEAVIMFLVIWSNGFFAHSVAVNIQIIADAFSTAGLMMLLFAGLMYVSGEGALLGIGFILKSVVLIFIPMGRLRHEKYADYRARKLSEAQKRSNRHIFLTGLVFAFIGIVFTVIWHAGFYQV